MQHVSDSPSLLPPHVHVDDDDNNSDDGEADAEADAGGGVTTPAPPALKTGGWMVAADFAVAMAAAG